MHFLLSGCLCTAPSTGRIPLMISMSVCKTKQKLLTWRLWEQSRLEPGVREAEHFTLLRQ